jgi:hypothetical protein
MRGWSLDRWPHVAAFGFAAGACAGGPLLPGPTEQPAAPVVAALPPAFPAEEIVGRWGVASYHKEDDRARTEVNARGACTKAYVIGRGPNGGVMMYPADSAKQEEMFLKGAPGGKTYIGPEPTPGVQSDREVVSFDGRVLILRWLDPEVQGRYGTFVYVRCGPRA